MKLIPYVFTLLFLLTSNILSAQDDVHITGVVMDKEINQPLEYATIAFFSKKENRIVTGGITDLEGKFDIKVPRGTYDISIEYISYGTLKLPNKTLLQNTNLGVLNLVVDAQALGEVSIIAERTTVEIKLDKKIYSVGQDLTVRGGTVSDVLDNIPSVSVDVEGNVSMRGNDNVTILINGKPSGLVGLNSTDALRQLPAESIERVEVITSPSARYDAEGTAGILNIILKRSKLQGLNGAITANVGHAPTAGLSGNINYRTGDFNFFNTTSYTYRESPGKSSTETEYFNIRRDEFGNVIEDKPNTFLNENRDSERESKNFTTNFGVEWYINDSASLTTSVVFRKSDTDNNATNLSREFDLNSNLISLSERFDPEVRDDKTIQYSVNFNKQFGGNSQHKLTFDFQYETNDEDNRSSITQDSAPVERVLTLQTQDKILLASDYVLPLGSSSQFEFGYRGNFNNLDTDYSLEFYENGNYELDTNVSNNLIYRDYINSVYTQFGSKLGNKFSYLAGLRMEAARITIDQKTSNDFEKKNYAGLFPTLNLGYEIDENQSIQLGYNRRIRRPWSRFINPFPSRTSPTSVFQGNPNIDPSYSNKVDLGFLKKFNKFTLNSSLYYERATDVFNFITEATGDFYIRDINMTINENDPNFDFITSQYESVNPVVRRTPINLATNDRYGFEFTLSYRASKNWNVNGNFNLFKSKSEGVYNEVDYGAENLSWFARINNKLTLPGKIDWQTRIFYMGPTEDAQNKSKGMFSTDLAFSKDLFNDNASLAFNVSDIFNTRKRITDTFTDTFNSSSEYQWRQRTFNLSFTYRFNQQKKQQRSMERSNGGDEFEFEG